MSDLFLSMVLSNRPPKIINCSVQLLSVYMVHMVTEVKIYVTGK